MNIHSTGNIVDIVVESEKTESDRSMSTIVVETVQHHCAYQLSRYTSQNTRDINDIHTTLNMINIVVVICKTVKQQIDYNDRCRYFTTVSCISIATIESRSRLSEQNIHEKHYIYIDKYRMLL